MEAALRWVNEKLAPRLFKVTEHRWLKSIMGGFSKFMPLLIVGALIQFVMNIANLAAPSLAASLKVMSDLTFNLLALYLAFGVAYALATRLEVSPLVTGLLAMSAFVLLMKPAFTAEGLFQIDSARLGPQGLFVAIVAGICCAEVMALFLKRKWTIGGQGLPDFVAEWFQPILPIAVVLIVCWLIAYVAGFDLYATLAKVLTPLMSASDSFPAFMLMAFVLVALFTVGINGAVTFPVLFPLWMANVGQNAAMAAQGLPPPHINTIQTLTAFVVLGGSGATLTLNLLMLRSKAKALKALGRAAILPSLMNINEPLIFGLPIAFNPILAIPFILNGALINPFLAYMALSSGLVGKPIVPAPLPWLPVGVTAYLFTQDIKAPLLVLVELVINIVVWYPFFKAHERRTLEKEAQPGA